MDSLQRYSDWPERLANVLDEKRNMPFLWGENDCCTFSADCIAAMTGTDLAKPYRIYRTKSAAKKLLKFHGGVPGLIDMLAMQYQLPKIEPFFMQRGDLCLFNIGMGATVGICLGSFIAAPGLKKLQEIPLIRVKQAWRVG